jgi:heptosyltransferase-1
MNHDLPPRLLLIKLSSFGDIIHTLPALEALRAAFPQGRLTWLVEEGYAPLLAGHPALDEVWPVPRLRLGRGSINQGLAGWVGVLRRLPRHSFDIVIDLQGLLKSALWVAMARSSRKVGYNGTRELSYLALTERLPPYDPDAHAVWRYLNVAWHLGAPQAPPRFRLEHLLTDAGRFLRETIPRPYVVLHPGARWATKLWPTAAWARLAEGLAGKGVRVVLTGSAGDLGLAQAIVAECKALVFNWAGRTAIGELAAVLQGAAFAVTTDTGPMHLAAALGTRVVALFGPTAPWRTGPFGRGHEIVRLGLACSPCFRRQCPDPRCLTELPMAAVMAACEKMLSQGAHLLI